MKHLITLILLVPVLAFSQKKDKNIFKGNKEFQQRNYTEAEASYRIAQSNTPTNASGAYNLGNAIYRQKQLEESAHAYAAAIKNARTKQQKHMAYHNLGNVFMAGKDYQRAVEAYKNALRNNPADEETRYNFALAKKMLKDNPPPPPKPDDKKDDKKNKEDKKDQPQKPQDNKGDGKGKDKDKDKGKDDPKDKGDKGDQKDKGDGDKKNEGKDKGQPKQEPGDSPSKQRMENLLDAMNNEEKKIQQKVQAKKVKVQPKRQEKDW